MDYIICQLINQSNKAWLCLLDPILINQMPPGYFVTYLKFEA